jgi:hypothetical protein
MLIKYKHESPRGYAEPVEVYERPGFDHRVTIYRAMQDEYGLTFKEVEFLVSRAYELDEMEIVRENN